MQDLQAKHALAKQCYDSGSCPASLILPVVIHCLTKLRLEGSPRLLAEKNNKIYWIYEAGPNLTRPYLPDLFIADVEEFTTQWNLLLANIDEQNHVFKLQEETVNKVAYTAVMSFALCFDLWKPTSRKTPGTFFEVFLGALIAKLIPQYKRTKHIPLPEQVETVATDIVFTTHDEKSGIIIPAKITTRERIVQPYAHQRIVESIFGNRFKSILICVSEMQRDGLKNFNEICVPGTIKLFQKHLAKLSGIYYIDPPNRYLQADVTEVVPVGTLGKFLTADLATLL